MACCDREIKIRLLAALGRSPVPARLPMLMVCLGLVLLPGCTDTSIADSGVYVAEANAWTATRIGGPAGAPVWAPNASAIAWANEDGLFIGKLDASSAMRLTESPVSGRPAWSPDSRSLAYVDLDTAVLVVADANSGAARFSTPVMTDDAQHEPLGLLAFGGPAWAPDGSRLAFNCWDGTGDEVCVIRADGTDRRQLTRIEPNQAPDEAQAGVVVPAPANIGPPAWAPDGNALAVASYPERRGAPRGIFVVDLEGGSARRVSSLVPNSEITWFLDGGSVIFSTTEAGRSDVHRVSIRDDDVANLTAGLSQPARDPALAPDGLRLAVASGGAIVIVGLDGEVESTVSSPLREWSPSWSPKGDTLAFAADADPIASFP